MVQGAGSNAPLANALEDHQRPSSLRVNCTSLREFYLWDFPYNNNNNNYWAQFCIENRTLSMEFSLTNGPSACLNSSDRGLVRKSTNNFSRLTQFTLIGSRWKLAPRNWQRTIVAIVNNAISLATEAILTQVSLCFRVRGEPSGRLATGDFGSTPECLARFWPSAQKQPVWEPGNSSSSRSGYLLSTRLSSARLGSNLDQLEHKLNQQTECLSLYCCPCCPL